MEKILKDIGEFGLIDEIKRWARPNTPRVRLGIGDDAAVLSAARGKDILFTTDMLIEDRHFRRSEATAYEIGRKALAVNLSDIAAMGGVPTSAVIAAGLPADLPVDFAREMYRGLKDLARVFKVDIAGGDTNLSEKIILSVALLGEVPRGKALKRSGAKNGDVVFVTGSLGGSYASKKHLHFIPRIKEAGFLAGNFNIHSMMDISDGLAMDIHKIAKASRVGILLSERAIPSSGDIQRALTDGEDFELLFTLPPAEAAKLTLTPPKKGLAAFHPVGKVVEKKYGVRLVKNGGTVVKLAEKGFDHFR
ncbi:MAG: thiamine-phosphate kinase [Candidatus Omnitrophica bacterium]|nr:thiamine-phosphate kinase [Candidatus Omnitrophota bacterium]